MFALLAGLPSGPALFVALLPGLPSGPALFVALLAVVFLAFPCFYLYMALRERGVFGRRRGE